MIASFNIPANEIFKANMWAWLFKNYIESSDESEYDNKVSELITLSGNTGRFTNYIPAGKTFQTIGDESFTKTMRALLTTLLAFYGKESLSEYNMSMQEIMDSYYENMQEAEKELEETHFIEDRDERLQLISVGFLSNVQLDTYHNTLMGCKEELDKVNKILSDLLLELDDKVHEIIVEVITVIGKDTEGTYNRKTIKLDGQPKNAKTHLIKMGLLIEVKEESE